MKHALSPQCARLALKAQAQARATVETLGVLKNPPIVYAKQANFAGGHQHVNNAAPHAGRARPAANELLEAPKHGQWLDTGAAGKAGTADPDMATVGEVNGAAYEGG